MLIRKFEENDIQRLICWAGENQHLVENMAATMGDGDYLSQAKRLPEKFEQSAKPLSEDEGQAQVDRVVYLALYRDKVPAGQVHRQGPLGIATVKFIRDGNGEQSHISYVFEEDSNTPENRETVTNQSFESYTESVVKRVLAL